MSKINLLLDVVSALRGLADSIQTIAEVMTCDGTQADDKTTEPVTAPPKPQPPIVTVEQVRAVLAEKSQSGLTAGVRTLLIKFGASRLSEIDPENFTALLSAAEELK